MLVSPTRGFCVVNRINGRGEVVGNSVNEKNDFGIYWDASGNGYSVHGNRERPKAELTSISDSGEIVGGCSNAANPSSRAATVWRERSLTPTLLPTVAGMTQSFALSNNRKGQIVGHAYGPNPPSVAVLWERGRAFVLHDLVDAGGWRLEVATGINDSGDIVGRGYAPRIGHVPFLLTKTGDSE